MSTRSMIAVRRYSNGSYELFYRHTDGYPTALGAELLRALQALRSENRIGLLTGENTSTDSLVSRIIGEVKAKAENRYVEKPEDAFLKVQSDLEYVYAIELEDELDLIRLTVYGTSNPLLAHDFAFTLWSSYLVYAPFTETDVTQTMDTIEGQGRRIIKALAEFEKAAITPLIKRIEELEKQSLR